MSDAVQTPALRQPFAVATERRSIDPRPVGIATAGIVLLGLYLHQFVSWRQGALFLVGVG
ncbi:MAG: hypothetical protein HYX76_03170, partial [Acidobacteria bacterium]|nr:hypothetical protein [Acidobacteriota bacterium]